jgi:hypothetical protein
MVSLEGQVRTRGKAKNRQGVYLNEASVAQIEASRLPTVWAVDRSKRTVQELVAVIRKRPLMDS